MQMAKRAGVRISDSELNQAMNRIAQQNRLSLSEFRRALERDGISYGDMREQIRREMMIGRVQQGIMRNRIDITEQAIDNFLESEVGANITSDEYRVAHILISIPTDASAAQVRASREEAEAILADLEAGADFQSLAVEKSAGQNALEGGDLGWRKPVQLPTMFADIAQEMTIGEVRGPIKSGSGYHLIQLLQMRGATAEGQVSQTEVRHVLIKVSRDPHTGRGKGSCREPARRSGWTVVPLKKWPSCTLTTLGLRSAAVTLAGPGRESLLMSLLLSCPARR